MFVWAYIITKSIESNDAFRDGWKTKSSNQDFIQSLHSLLSTFSNVAFKEYSSVQRPI